MPWNNLLSFYPYSDDDLSENRYATLSSLELEKTSEEENIELQKESIDATEPKSSPPSENKNAILSWLNLSKKIEEIDSVNSCNESQITSKGDSQYIDNDKRDDLTTEIKSQENNINQTLIDDAACNGAGADGAG